MEWRRKIRRRGGAIQTETEKRSDVCEKRMDKWQEENRQKWRWKREERRQGEGRSGRWRRWWTDGMEALMSRWNSARRNISSETPEKARLSINLICICFILPPYFLSPFLLSHPSSSLYHNVWDFPRTRWYPKGLCPWGIPLRPQMHQAYVPTPHPVNTTN